MADTAPPVISVLMPAYNAERYIETAIESILDQTFGDFELLVIDDGSIDGTAAVVKHFADMDSRVQLITCAENGGIAKALNRGLNAATGRFIARMDADDWSYPTRFERQVSLLNASPDVVICGAAIEICDSNLKPVNVRRYHETDPAIRKRLFRYSPFAHPVVMYRAAIARAVDGYNPTLSDADDYDFYFRMGVHGRFSNLPQTLHRLRTRRDSVSQAKGQLQERLTIYIRFKAAVEYGYPMSSLEFAYTLVQYASTYFIPARVKFWIFALLRGRRPS